MNGEELVEEYARLIEPILPMAKRAYGLREQVTPAHEASREYTRLLLEYQSRGGSLPTLAKRLGVAYAGVRRRVVMSGTSVSKHRPASRLPRSAQNVEAAAERVRAAKAVGVARYHDQLALEYRSGISLAALARHLGLSSAAPLYYGVQRSIQRNG
jgi:AraC-like DNA-binding protein